MNGPRRVHLDDIVESLDYGVTASAEWLESGPKFLRITDIQSGAVDWPQVPWCTCSAREASERALRPGDIVFARTGATTGKSFLLRKVPEDAVFASYLIRIRLSQKADPVFISHFFNSDDYWNQINQSSRGAAQPGINASVLRALQIPLPPLEEQRRIAAILDKAARIQSAAAERASRATAALYRSLLIEELSKLDADKVQLGDFLQIARGGSPRPIQAFLTNEPSGINWIMIGDTIVGEKYITKTAKMIKPEGLSKTRLVTEGDLLLSNSMSFGRPYIMKTDGAIHDGWLLLRDSAQNSSPDYLYHVLGSPLCYSQFVRAAAGATVKNLNTAIVSSVEIPLPALEKQLEIAARLDSVEVKVGSRFAALSIKAEELKASLFGSFFGEG